MQLLVQAARSEYFWATWALTRYCATLFAIRRLFSTSLQKWVGPPGPSFDKNQTRTVSSTMSQSRYHSYIQSLSPRWRVLEHLDDFLKENRNTSRLTGSPKPRLAVLNFDNMEVTSHVIDIYDLAEVLQNTSSRKGGRLFLVEDLSNEVIEILGTHLDIEPEFFASHIYGLDWFPRTSSMATIPRVRSATQGQSFVKIRYLETRSVARKNDHPVGIHRPACMDSNVLRKVSIMKLESTKGLVGFCRRHVTIWMKPNTNVTNWTGEYPSKKTAYLRKALYFSIPE